MAIGFTSDFGLFLKKMRSTINFKKNCLWKTIGKSCVFNYIIIYENSLENSHVNDYENLTYELFFVFNRQQDISFRIKENKIKHGC